MASFGLLGLGSTYARLASTTTHNEYLAQIAVLSNAYWGVVQANPAIVASMGGTYTRANVTAAPAALQGWLTGVTGSLPNAVVVIATGPDAATGASCTMAGCSSTLTIRWSQNVNPNSGATTALVRSQTFNYQFGF